MSRIAKRYTDSNQNWKLKMTRSIDLEVSYGQLAVFQSALDRPFNDWTDQHFSQGFSWRPGSVSFRTMAEAGAHSIEIDICQDIGAVPANAVRVIDVPFVVPVDGNIEVGSITETVSLSLPAGSYLLRCEFLQSDKTEIEQVRLVFASKSIPNFAVVRADEALCLGEELLTTAQAARVSQ
jgi:hypothetical protein